MKNTYIPKGGWHDEKNRYINSGEIKRFEVGHFSHESLNILYTVR